VASAFCHAEDEKMTAPKAKRFGFAEFTLTTFQNLTK
jgi:hypothetical protein